VKGGLKTKEFENTDFEVIVGSEIGTERGEVIGLFLSEEILSHRFVEVVDEIKEQNGWVVLPHPFDKLRGNGVKPVDNDAKLVDCIETFNSRCLLDSYNENAREYAEKHHLNSLAGSDAHFAHEIGNAGVDTPSEDLQDALLRGNFTIFGKKSSFINLGLTKVLKTWRKTSFG
jgi:hypothetical protein